MPKRKLYEKLEVELDEVERTLVGWRTDLFVAMRDRFEGDKLSPKVVLRVGEIVGTLDSAAACVKRAQEDVKGILEFDVTHDEKLFKDD